MKPTRPLLSLCAWASVCGGVGNVGKDSVEELAYNSAWGKEIVSLTALSTQTWLHSATPLLQYFLVAFYGFCQTEQGLVLVSDFRKCSYSHDAASTAGLV